MFERVSLQVESSPCCDRVAPSSDFAPHSRNGVMFGPVEIGDSSTHRCALRCGASRFGPVNDGACGLANGQSARSTASRGRHRFRASPTMPDAAITTPWAGGIGGGESPSGRSEVRRQIHGALGIVDHVGRCEAEFTIWLIPPARLVRRYHSKTRPTQKGSEHPHHLRVPIALPVARELIPKTSQHPMHRRQRAFGLQDPSHRVHPRLGS